MMSRFVRICRAILKKTVRLALEIVLTPVAIPIFLLGIRFFDMKLLNRRIGHLAYEPELYIKTGLLGWRPRFKAILLAPASMVVNPCLLDYWSRQISVIRQPLLTTLLRPLTYVTYLKARYTVLAGGRILKLRHRNLSQYAVQTQYEAIYGDKPLLNLTPEHRQRGWQCLESLGVPQDAWFVCLHVREPGYLPACGYHSFRDADIMTYLPAAKYIVEQGGWVIRMGDPTMKPLPAMPQVIDYAHSRVRSDWMDVFCCAQCRFLLGTSSGLFILSYVFGVPCACANFTPFIESTYSSKDIYIPKFYYSEPKNRLLTFKELLDTKISKFLRTEEFTSNRIKVLDNSEEEILELTKEMFAKVNGSLQYTLEDEFLQEKYRTLFLNHGIQPAGSRVGKDFLRKHPYLL